jgi:surfeit locus 1 family protein
VSFAFTVGHRRFAPSWPMTVLAFVAIVTFIACGRWQWDRGVERSAQWQAFERSGSPQRAGSAAALDELARFARVELRGRYDGARQILLDNRTRDGRAGYEVLTPLALAEGGTVLVNRGWVPFTGVREQLPDVALPANETDVSRRVSGRVDELPVAGIDWGRAPVATSGAWPRVTSFPQTAELAAALGRPVAARIVLLDDVEPLGFTRAWRPPGMAPQRHYSYAVQWWGFAAAVFVLYVVLNLRRVER